MKPGRPSSSILGGEAGSTSVRLVSVERFRTGFRLTDCCETVYSGGLRFQGVIDSTTRSILNRTLQTLLLKCSPRILDTVIGIDNRAFIVKRIPVDPRLTDDELRDQALWEARHLVTESLENYVIDYHPTSLDPGPISLIWSATRERLNRS